MTEGCEAAREEDALRYLVELRLYRRCLVLVASAPGSLEGAQDVHKIDIVYHCKSRALISYHYTGHLILFVGASLDAFCILFQMLRHFRPHSQSG